MQRMTMLVLVVVLSAGSAFSHDQEQHIMGTVTAFTDNSISLTTTENQSVTVYTMTETKYEKGGVAASKNDLKVGERVVIHASKMGEKVMANLVRLGVVDKNPPHAAAPGQATSHDNMPGMQMGTPPNNQQTEKPKKDDMQNMPGMEHQQTPDKPGTEHQQMQDMPGMNHQQMPGMQMDENSLMSMHPKSFLQEIVHHTASGTSAEPNSTPTPMLMTMKGTWMLMFHANVFLTDIQQSSARGGDKFFSTNWLMGMAQRELGPGVFTARVMLSLEPATITRRRYPLLFQQGETAYGLPIADGQHPHDFIMELAALYDLKLGEKTLLSFYFAPMGDPAMGPTAYPHRASAAENPVGTLGHHQQDSTHIADDVVTVGLTYGIVRVEASGFHGREPDEFRWDIDQGKIDSWSARLTFQPGQNWSGQYSYARIKSPEAIFPGENQARMTASLMYNRPLHNGNWTNTLLWGRTRSLQDNSVFNSYLLESTVRFRVRNHAWTRIENADRSNGLLLGENPLPSNFTEKPIGRVQAYTFGYNHDFDVIPHLTSAIGVQFTTYGVADSLRPAYGSHPAGVALFVRLRPFSGDNR